MNTSHYATSYPTLDPEGIVTEGHAAYCRTHGHASYKYNGIVSDYCPRCGYCTTSDTRKV